MTVSQLGQRLHGFRRCRGQQLLLHMTCSLALRHGVHPTVVVGHQPSCAHNSSQVVEWQEWPPANTCHSRWPLHAHPGQY